MIASKILPRVALGATLSIAVISIASAAPQVLGLVATLAPIPLTCEAGTCKAEFSSFCLQKERDVPHAKWHYAVANAGSVHLLLTRPDGQVERVDAAPFLTIRAPRGFSAVEIGVPADTLASLGAVAAAVEVAPDTALAPVARADDSSPISEAERAVATGPLRTLGTRIVDRDPEVLASARALNGLINALPDVVLVGEGARRTLWQRAVGTGLVARDGAEHAVARATYESCWRDVPVAYGLRTVRHCVQVRHDAIMVRKNRAFWSSVDAGT